MMIEHLTGTPRPHRERPSAQGQPTEIRSRTDPLHVRLLAAAYTLVLPGQLTRFLEYPKVELSRKLAENSMHPVAVGRRKSIHIDGEKAGPRVAAILSGVESCRRMNIRGS